MTEYVLTSKDSCVSAKRLPSFAFLSLICVQDSSPLKSTISVYSLKCSNDICSQPLQSVSSQNSKFVSLS